ncbi:MAG TPA: restriction endonuclease [Beijerinckiaceae bacterium]|jgi:hypothetical protein
MAVWTYDSSLGSPAPLAEVEVCPYCSTPLQRLSKERRNHKGEDIDDLALEVCQTCGWWKAVRETQRWGPYSDYLKMAKCVYEKFCGVGALRNLDLTDVSLPVNEVRSFLLSRYESRYSIDPFLFEKTVGAVFKDLGYETLVTARSGDGGIDVILNKGNENIGVQVKRYKNSIKVEQILSLIGALVDAGIPKGVFVTTSNFQRGVYSYAERHRIELLDAGRFYDALKLAQRPQYKSKEDFLYSHDMDKIIEDMHKIGGFDGW